MSGRHRDFNRGDPEFSLQQYLSRKAYQRARSVALNKLRTEFPTWFETYFDEALEAEPDYKPTEKRR